MWVPSFKKYPVNCREGYFVSQCHELGKQLGLIGWKTVDGRRAMIHSLVEFPGRLIADQKGREVPAREEVGGACVVCTVKKKILGGERG